jgi:cold shock protein
MRRQTIAPASFVILGGLASGCSVWNSPLNAHSVNFDGMGRILSASQPWREQFTTRTLPMTTNGTIKRITDRGFGFIATAEGLEYFFHQSACAGTPFDQLREGQTVSFTVGQGPKGPRAENVNVR